MDCAYVLSKVVSIHVLDEPDELEYLTLVNMTSHWVIDLLPDSHLFSIHKFISHAWIIWVDFKTNLFQFLDKFPK